MSKQEAATKSKTKRYVILGVKLAVVAAVAWWIVGTVRSEWGDLTQIGTLRYGWLCAAALFYLVGLLPAGVFWYSTLRMLGQKVGFVETLRAYFIGHLGKYVPGKAMVVVLRAGLIRGQDIHRGVAAVSVFLETLTMMASGAFIAALVLAIWFHDQTWLMLLALGLMLAAGTPTIPPVFRLLVKLARVGKSDPNIQQHIASINGRTLLFGWCCMAVCWTLLGLSMWATLGGLGLQHGGLVESLPHFVGAVSLAMVAGFLSLIFPGGIGPRDMVLKVLMVPYFAAATITMSPEAAATLAAALLRIVWLFSELAISLVLFVAVRPKKTMEEQEVFEDPLRGPHQTPARSPAHTPTGASAPSRDQSGE